MIFSFNHNVPQGQIQTESLNVKVSGLNSTSKVAVIYRVDDTHCNAPATWRNMGSPMYPTKNQIAMMVNASELVPTFINFTVIDSQTIQFQYSLPPHGIAVITYPL